MKTLCISILPRATVNAVMQKDAISVIKVNICKHFISIARYPPEQNLGNDQKKYNSNSI